MAALKWSSIALTAALLSFAICSAALADTVRDAAPAPSAEDNMIDSEMVLKNDHIDCNCGGSGGGCGCGGACGRCPPEHGQVPGNQYYCQPANCGGDPACGGGGFTMSFDSYVPASANAHD